MAEINFRARIDVYSNRVLGVVKEKYGLKDKSQALNKFIEMYGEDFIEREVKDEFISDVHEIVREHYKRHPKRRMSVEELNKLVGS